MSLLLIGLSHHSAPIEVRERLTYTEHALPDALTSLACQTDIREVVLLSTCNRTEIYLSLDRPDSDDSFNRICRHLAETHSISEKFFEPHLYLKRNEEASEHLLRVAAGLDFMVLGEAQIIGQVRTALRVAQETGTVGSILTALFQQAVMSSRRVQNETGLGRGAFSIGHAAVDLASHIFSDLSRASVLILGAGKMSELTAKHLMESGVRFVVVANRTYEKAEAMAARLGGTAIHYDTFTDKLATADIVISSTSAPHPILRRENLLPAVRKRRGKPLFLIDIAVPRDIDPDVSTLDSVFLYNIDDLQAVVAEEANARAGEVAKAQSIVAMETQNFMTWYREREAVPVITRLRERLESIRQAELDTLRSRLGNLTEREWQAVENATRAMMNRVSREPILRLKQETGQATERTDRYDLLTATREIFALHEDAAQSPTLIEEVHETPPEDVPASLFPEIVEAN